MQVKLRDVEGPDISVNSRHFGGGGGGGGGGAEIESLTVLVGQFKEGLVKGQEEEDLRLEDVEIGRELKVVVVRRRWPR